MEIRRIGPYPSYCFQGVSTYRIVVEKNNLNDIQRDWRNWKGETRHTICDCYFQNKTTTQLIEILSTKTEGINVYDQNDIPSNSFLKFIYLLTTFLEHMQIIKSNISITFFG